MTDRAPSLPAPSISLGVKCLRLVGPIELRRPQRSILPNFLFLFALFSAVRISEDSLKRFVCCVVAARVHWILLAFLLALPPSVPLEAVAVARRFWARDTALRVG